MNGFHLALVTIGALLGAAPASAQSIIHSELTTTTLAETIDRDGQTVLTATVQTAQGSGVPGGTIRFIDDTTLMVLGWADPAQPSVTLPALAPGPHRLYAAYSGTAEFLPLMVQPSRSPTLLHMVRDKLDATVVSSLNPSARGDMVTLTARIGRAGDRPQGRVSFRDGDEVIAAHVGLDHAGMASFTTSALPDGPRAITVFYEGDTRHAPVVSRRLVQDVGGRHVVNALPD